MPGAYLRLAVLQRGAEPRALARPLQIVPPKVPCASLTSPIRCCYLDLIAHTRC